MKQRPEALSSFNSQVSLILESSEENLAN